LGHKIVHLGHGLITLDRLFDGRGVDHLEGGVAGAMHAPLAVGG